MQATQNRIECYAERIEHAYGLRRPCQRKSLVATGVWSVAAEIMLSVHENGLAIAPDPELFVAAQPLRALLPDPWVELAGKDSARKYRERLETIVRDLRRELRGEVRYAEARITAGENATTVLTSRSRRLSPLGRYIVAHRANLHALAGRFHRGAVRQHNSCPLYRLASKRFLAPELYPSSNTPEAVLIRRQLPRVQSN